MKRIGLKGQYYRKPESMGIESVKSSQILTHRLDLVKAHYGVNDHKGTGAATETLLMFARVTEPNQVQPRDHYLFLPNSSVFNYMLEYERRYLRAATSPSRLKKDERLRVPSASNDRPTQRLII